MRYYKFVLKSIDPLDDDCPIKTHIFYEAGKDYSKCLRNAFDSAIEFCESLAQDFVSITDEKITDTDMKVIKRIEKKLGCFSEIVWQ